jgi:hypothetical protein
MQIETTTIISDYYTSTTLTHTNSMATPNPGKDRYTETTSLVHCVWAFEVRHSGNQFPEQLNM